MARGPGTYSAMVSWLKLLLPLVALGLLSTIFLFARSTDPTENIPVATARDLADRGSEEVTAPSYSGTTDSGAMLRLEAARARPDPDAEGDVLAEALTGAMTFEDGGRIDLAAPAARVVDADGTALLSGGVEIESSQGYVLRTPALTTSLSRIAVETDGRVEGTGPAGRITAGRMRIEESTAEGGAPGDVRLLFTDGVDVIYEP